MRVLLIEALNGISGDMFVAAAAPLAGCEAEVIALPGRLGLPDVRCRFSNVVRSTLQCRHFLVTEGDSPADTVQDHAYYPPRAQPHSHGHGAEHEHDHHHGHEHDHGHDPHHGHDHDHGHEDHHGHGHSHGHSHEHGEPHDHDEDHPHEHDAPHSHEHGEEHGHEHGGDEHAHHGHHGGTHGHHHEHRSLATIQEMIRRADLEPPVRDRALRMFERLGAVEAAAHGIPVEQVHFHEVGAIDSIVDIVAAALCIERLKITETYSTPICLGSGSVRTAHGLLPVPAPATEKLLQQMPTTVGDLTGEWTTPTGALILHELQPKFSIPTLVTTASALGGGTRNPPGRPNVLRLRLAETSAISRGPLVRDEVCAIFANIDDSTGEMLGADLIELLLRAGARDALIHPVIMKKGRPAHQLEVLAEPQQATELAELILTHTSTIGVRLMTVQRLMLPRDPLVVPTTFGEIAAKRVTLPSGAVRVMPEYESCREAAARAGVSVQEVFRSALTGGVR